jgi:hypothetical protein
MKVFHNITEKLWGSCGKNALREYKNCLSSSASVALNGSTADELEWLWKVVVTA